MESWRLSDMAGEGYGMDKPITVDSNEYPDDVSISSFATPRPPSIIDYQFENGRRYHAYRQGTYLYPNDEKEQERLDLAFDIQRIILEGNLHRCPLPPRLRRVLDVGTGTGRWAIDFADEHPECEVIGTDLSLIQHSSTPPNCHFILDDHREPWLFDEKFDYIHAREIKGTVPDWGFFYGEIMKNLVPGGWVEIQETDSCWTSDDDTLERATFTRTWNEKWNEAGRLHGQPLDIAREQQQHLRDAGFEDINEFVFKIPIGTWPKNRKLKEIGRITLYHNLEGLDGVTIAYFTRYLGWSREQVEDLVAGVKSEMMNHKNHLYVMMRFIYGRKPQSVEDAVPAPEPAPAP